MLIRIAVTGANAFVGGHRLLRLVDAGEPAAGHRFGGTWLDIGRQEDDEGAADVFEKGGLA